MRLNFVNQAVYLALGRPFVKSSETMIKRTKHKQNNIVDINNIYAQLHLPLKSIDNNS